LGEELGQGLPEAAVAHHRDVPAAVEQPQGRARDEPRGLGEEVQSRAGCEFRVAAFATVFATFFTVAAIPRAGFLAAFFFAILFLDTRGRSAPVQFLLTPNHSRLSNSQRAPGHSWGLGKR